MKCFKNKKCFGRNGAINSSFKIWLESKTAIIIKGNPKFIKNNDFYQEIADYLTSKGFSVEFDNGEEYTIPPKADIWIGHSRGADRLKYAPKETKTIAFGSKLPNAINHPKDDVETSFHTISKSPPEYHFVFTDEMKKAIDQSTK